MTIRSPHNLPERNPLFKGWFTRSLILLGLCFALLMQSACGEDEEAEASADETTKVENKTSASKSKEDAKKKADEAREKRKQERAEKRKELAEKRRKKAKVSADARKKAINEAAQAQSGRPASAAKVETTTGSKPSGPAATGRRVLRQPEAPRNFIPLNIDRILPVSDVKELTGEKRLTDLGPLAGIPQSETYNSRYVAPPKRSTFGSSVQVWKETLMRDMNERYSRMRRDYPNVTDTNAITPKGFFSYWNDFMTLVFMDFQKKLLVAVSCGTKICTPEELYELAKRAKQQL